MGVRTANTKTPKQKIDSQDDIGVENVTAMTGKAVIDMGNG